MADPKAPETREWVSCAAGLQDGTVLVVCTPGGICIAVKPGPYTTEITWEQLKPLLSSAGLAIVSDAEHVAAEKALAWLQSTPETLGKNEGMMVLALRRLEAERTP